MPQANLIKVQMVQTGVTGQAWAGEKFITTLSVRYDTSLAPTHPSQGPLGNFNVDIRPGLENATNYSIEWQHYAPATVGSFTGPTQDDFKLIADQLNTAYQQNLTYWPTYTQLSSISMWCVSTGQPGESPAGKSVGGTNTFNLKTPQRGQSSQGLAPNVALVMSEYSGLPGRRYKGRMYLGPLTSGAALSTPSSGLVNATGATAILGPYQAAFNAINASGRLFVCVPHARDRSYADVRTLRIGNQFDVQNRRRNAIRETYTDVQLT
jgi:hypothetical protein